MKRTIDGAVKQQQKNVFNPNNCYLSETAEILWCSLEEIKKQNMKYQAFNGAVEICLKLVNNGDQNQQNLKVHFLCGGDVNQIYYLGIGIPVIGGDYFKIKHNKKFTSKLINLGEEKNIVVGDDNVSNISRFFRQYLNEHIVVILWKQGFLEEEKLTLELTDCIIRSNNDKITYQADVKKLISTSPVLYNMVNDLNKIYNHENPLDLTEIFKEFHYQHIRMYLCCVYNKNFMPKQLIHILSLLKISVKLDNQRLIQQILEVRSLGSIVRDQVVKDDPQHPCYVQNVLDFAKQHDLHQLSVFCQLVLIDISEEKTSDQMQEILQVFKRK